MVQGSQQHLKLFKYHYKDAVSSKMFTDIYVDMYTTVIIYIPFTVNTPEVESMPMIFSASQVYAPTSDDSAFIILRTLSIIDSFRYTDELLYLELSDKFTITPLKYHLIYGTGTPMA